MQRETKPFCLGWFFKCGEVISKSLFVPSNKFSTWTKFIGPQICFVLGLVLGRFAVLFPFPFVSFPLRTWGWWLHCICYPLALNHFPTLHIGCISPTRKNCNAAPQSVHNHTQPKNRSDYHTLYTATSAPKWRHSLKETSLLESLSSQPTPGSHIFVGQGAVINKDPCKLLSPRSQIKIDT